MTLTVSVIGESSLLNCLILFVHTVFVHFQLGEEKPRPWSGCNDVCSFKFRAEASEIFRGMVMANTTEISRAVNLTMPVISTVVAGHPGVVNSIAVIKGFLRRSARVGG
jgi:hypothetical protein